MTEPASPSSPLPSRPLVDKSSTPTGPVHRRDTLSPASTFHFNELSSRSPSPSTTRTSLTPSEHSAGGSSRRRPIDLPGSASPGRVKAAAALFESTGKAKDPKTAEKAADERSKGTYVRRLSSEQVAQITKSHSVPYSRSREPSSHLPPGDEEVERLADAPAPVSAPVPVEPVESGLGFVSLGASAVKVDDEPSRDKASEAEPAGAEAQGEEETIVVPIVIQEPVVEEPKMADPPAEIEVEDAAPPRTSTSSFLATPAASENIADVSPPSSSRSVVSDQVEEVPPSRPRSKIVAVNVTPSMDDDLDLPGMPGGSNLATQLDVLALSARMTEVDMTVQEVALLLFEVQELRHASTEETQKRAPDAKTSPGGQDDKLTPVDMALARMNRRFDEASRDMAALESAVAPYLSSTSAGAGGDEISFLKEKWDDLSGGWKRVDDGAETLKEELKEDAWLTVFRNASRQAEEMMDSLDKVLTSAQEFAWEVGRRKKGKEKSGSVDGADGFGEEERDELVKAYQALQKSFDTKRKYYVPSCERVLRILGKGIDERSTKNGEVLRRWSAMKARFKNIHDRLARTDRELAQVGSVLAGGPPDAEPQTPVKKERPDPASFLSPERGPPAMAGSAVSPFRRLVNRITPSRPLSPSPSSSPSQASGSPESTRTPLARSTKSKSRSALNLKPPTAPSPIPPVPHLSGDVAGNARGGRDSVAKGRTSVGEGAFRPPWNISLRPSKADERDPTVKSKKSALPKDYVPSAGMASPAARRPSEAFVKRATSPSVMSDDSNRTGLSASYRPRKSGVEGDGRASTSTKIPGPSWVVVGSNGQSELRSGTPSLSGMSYEYEEVLDSPPRDAAKRAASPAPSSIMSSASALSRSVGAGGGTPRTTSKIPVSSPQASGRRSVTPSQARTYLGLPGATSGGSKGLSQSVGPGRRAFSPAPSDLALMPPAAPPRWNVARSHTPEPSIVAKAGKVGGARRPPSRASMGGGTATPGRRVSHVPPVPSRGAPSPLPGAGKRSRPHSSMGASSVGGDLHVKPYEANPHDALDLAIAKLVGSQPLLLGVERVDAPLRPGVSPPEQVQYRFFSEDEAEEGKRLMREVKPVMCKLTSRTISNRGGLKVEKVMCRVKGAWQDLELHLLEKQGQVR